MDGSVNERGFLGFWRGLFRHRDRVVFVTARSPAAVRDAKVKQDETTAALRRVVAAGRVAR